MNDSESGCKGTTFLGIVQIKVVFLGKNRVLLMFLLRFSYGALILMRCLRFVYHSYILRISFVQD